MAWRRERAVTDAMAVEREAWRGLRTGRWRPTGALGKRCKTKARVACRVKAGAVGDARATETLDSWRQFGGGARWGEGGMVREELDSGAEMEDDGWDGWDEMELSGVSGSEGEESDGVGGDAMLG